MISIPGTTDTVAPGCARHYKAFSVAFEFLFILSKQRQNNRNKVQRQPDSEGRQHEKR
jgi:hypothetical protein